MSLTSGRILPRLALILAFGGLISIVTSGCGPSTCQVKGRVVYEDGKQAGSELEGYSVAFEAEEGQLSATGLIGPDGTFEVGTFENSDGAVAGRHRVAVTPPVHETDELPPPPVIDAKYAMFDKSGLVVEIKSGTNDVELKVQRKP